LTGFQKGLDASLLNGLVKDNTAVGVDLADGGRVNAAHGMTIGGQKVGLGVDTSVRDIVNGKEPDVSVSGLQLLAPVMGPLQQVFGPLQSLLGGQGALTSGLFQIPSQLIQRLRSNLRNILGGFGRLGAGNGGGLGGGLGGNGGAGLGAGLGGGLGAGLGNGLGGGAGAGNGIAFGFGR